jgi:hypothetical protein
MRLIEIYIIISFTIILLILASFIIWHSPFGYFGVSKSQSLEDTAEQRPWDSNMAGSLYPASSRRIPLQQDDEGRGFFNGGRGGWDKRDRHDRRDRHGRHGGRGGHHKNLGRDGHGIYHGGHDHRKNMGRGGHGVHHGGHQKNMGRGGHGVHHGGHGVHHGGHQKNMGRGGHGVHHGAGEQNTGKRRQ